MEAVEASLRAGMQYVVQVRALAELGTDDAGRILERQLQRRLTDDQIEQAWYWIDLANGLRSLNRCQSLPHLLRCADSAGDIPLGHFFAAETICFLGFAGYLRQPDTPLGRAALRVLHRALEGLRCGVQPSVVAEARVGEMIETLVGQPRPSRSIRWRCAFIWKRCALLRRAPHAETMLAAEAAEQEAFSWQMSRLAALEAVLTEYLAEAPAPLVRATARERRRENSATSCWPWPICVPRPAPWCCRCWPCRVSALGTGPGSAGLVVEPARRPAVARMGAGARADGAPLADAAAAPSSPRRPSCPPMFRIAASCGRCAAIPRRRRKRFCCWPRATGIRPIADGGQQSRLVGAAAAARRAADLAGRSPRLRTPTCARPPRAPWPAWANGRRCNGSARR